MKGTTGRFRVPEGASVRLHRWATSVKPLYRSKDEYHDLLSDQVEELSKLQRLLYASNQYALLLIFQAMDAAGKDGAIAHVMSGVNPQGCQVFSFKHPSAEELEHDFLWRTTRAPPGARTDRDLQPLLLRGGPDRARAPGDPSGRRPSRRHELDGAVTSGGSRYESILGLERHLHRNGTRIVKFFLHLSKEEQRKRFLKRIDDPDRRWKFSRADLEERKYWRRYMKAYEDVPRRHQHRRLPLVRRPRRRQEERPAHRLADHRRDAGRPEDAVSDAVRTPACASSGRFGGS